MRSLPLICLCILMVSCSVKKRNYRKGYYIDWAFHHDKKSGTPSEKAHAIPPQKNAKSISREEILIAAAEKSLSRKELKKSEIPRLAKNSGCDTLFFRDGKMLAAKVLEILPHEIKYKHCDYTDGPTITVNKNNVAKVVYSNGMSDKFEVTHKIPDEEFYSLPQDQDIPKNHKAVRVMAGITILLILPVLLTLAAGLMVAAVGSAFLASLRIALLIDILFSSAGLIYSPMALWKIRKTKGKFKGEETVKTCMLVCLIALILSLVSMAFVLFLLAGI